MSRARKDTGDWGEQLAAEHLQSKGLAIVQRNVEYDFGELDIVAQDGDTLVFVEVKAFERLDPGADPAENVHRRKQLTIAKCAQAYIANMKPVPYCRFDVVTVVRQPLFRLEHHAGAFTL